jgi:methyltransferase
MIMPAWGSWLLWVLVIVQRLYELRIAQKNARWIREQGGVEYGGKHYPWLVLIHGCFFLSLLLEGRWGRTEPVAWWWVPFLLFLGVQGLRIWVMRSLGKFWNTRIYVIPGRKPQNRGPYRYVRHPNYVVVLLEFVLLPLCFGAYGTLIVFPLVKFLFLYLIRIPAEEKAWQMYGEDPDEIMKKHRFFPSFQK